MSRLLALLVLPLAFGIGAVHAQEVESEQDEDIAETQAQESAPAAAVSDANDKVADTRSGESAPAAAASSANLSKRGSGSGSDYEASEQISEDLSVSFPVDI